MPSGENIYTVCVPVASLYRRASRRSAKETELLLGTGFKVQSVNRGWAQGCAISPVKGSPYPGYEGYVPLKYLGPEQDNPTHVITGLCAPVFETADIKSPVQAMWPMNVQFLGKPIGDFIAANTGFVHMRHVRALSRAPAEADFVSIAEQYLGRPYIWAGVSSNGLDCSGLVQTGLRAVGWDIPRDSGDQALIGTEVLEGTPLKRGDLIFWRGHVGIMQDAERLLHANAYHMMVASEPLEAAISRICEAGQPVTARRRL